MGEDGCHAMGDSRQTLSAATKRLSGTMNGNVKKPMVWMGSGMLSLLFLLFFLIQLPACSMVSHWPTLDYS